MQALPPILRWIPAHRATVARALVLKDLIVKEWTKPGGRSVMAGTFQKSCMRFLCPSRVRRPAACR